MGFSNLLKASAHPLTHSLPPPLTNPSIFLALTLLTYIPHYRLMLSLHSTHGLSLRYLLFNAIAAIEQLTIFLYLSSSEIRDHPNVPMSIHSLPSFRDWLNVAQVAVV
jgi:hypothetical protein